MSENLPLVAIVGRPNVGKSTLFNRFLGRRVAIVEEKAKVTRDRKEMNVTWAGREFRVVDTGGWLAKGDELDAKVSAQAEAAIGTADLVLFIVDGNVGVTDEDETAAKMLLRSNTKAILVVNKVDSEKSEALIWEFGALGLGTPRPVSALHGRLSGDLLDEIVDVIDAPWEQFDEPRTAEAIRRSGQSRDGDELRVAIVGRPNVGKSTLFNRLIGEDRSVTHDMPGTTMDAIDTIIEQDGKKLRFVDTAGLRRKSRINEGTEYYSRARSLQAVDDADIVLLVIDSTEGITGQDQRLAERIDLSGSPTLILLNKWDLLDLDAKEDLEADIEDRLGFLGYVKPIRISALSGHNVHRIWKAIDEAQTSYRLRIPTGELNKLIQSIQITHPPKGTRILYAVQGATDPPTITLFASKTIETTYLRYIENRIRERFGLGQTPIKLRIRKRS